MSTKLLISLCAVIIVLGAMYAGAYFSTPSTTQDPVSVAAYSDSVRLVLNDYDREINRMGVLIDRFHANPAVANDQLWRNQVASVADRITMAGKRVKDLKHPAALAYAHKNFVAASDDLDRVAGDLLAGLTSASFDRVSGDLHQANDHLEIVAKVLASEHN